MAKQNIFWIIGLILITLLPNVFADLNQSIFINYPLDSNVLDSINNHNAAGGNIVKYYKLGNGSNYVGGSNCLTSTFALAYSTPQTLSVWIKYNSSIGSTSEYIIDCRAGGGTGYLYLSGNADNTADVLSSDGVIFINNTDTTAGYNKVEAGEWYHIVVVNITLQPSVDCQIGASNIGAAMFTGYIDEFTWWNRSLTPTEVGDLYNSGNGIAYPLSARSLGVTIIYPSNNTINNTVPNFYYYNVTNTGVNISNCSLWTNQTGNFSKTSDNNTVLWNTYSGGGSTDGTVSGGVTIDDGAMVFDGVDGEVSLTNIVQDGQTQVALNMWLNIDNTTSDNNLGLFSTSNGASRFSFYVSTNNADGRIFVEYKNATGVTRNIQLINGIVYNTDNMITLTYDGTTWRGYLNKQLILTDTNPFNDLFFSNLPYYLARDPWNPVPRNMQGKIYITQIFNKNLTTSEITQIYNAGKDAYSPVTDGLVAQYSGKDYSGTSANPIEIYNTAIPYPSNTMMYFGNSFAGDGDYLWNVQCIISNGTEYFSQNFTYTVDSVNPQVNSVFQNRTAYFQNNLTAQFNLSDNNLFRYNLSIDGLTYSYLTNIPTKDYIINFSSRVNNLSGINHVLNLEVADGHTAKNISSYSISRGLFGNYLKYNTGKNIIIITGYDDQMFNSFQTQKQTDRYVFQYYPNSAANIFTFDIETTYPMEIVELNQAPYRWIVTGNNWIDFYMVSYPDVVPEIDLIDKYHATVTVDINSIYNPPKDCPIGKRCPIGGTTRLMITRPAIQEAVFSSVGDLNIVNYAYLFYTVNISYYQNSSNYIVGTGDSTTFNLWMNTSGYIFNITSLNAQLEFNNINYSSTSKYLLATNITLFTYTKSWDSSWGNSSGINYTWRWFFNATSKELNISDNTNFVNLTILNLDVDNCSSYPIAILNFTMYDETTRQNTLINASIETDLNIKSGSINWYFNKSKEGNNLSICVPFNISAGTQHYYLTSVTRYQAQDHTVEYHYLDNFDLTENGLQKIDLYPLNTDITLSEYSTSFLFNYLNEYYLPDAGSIIDLLRYYVGTGEYISVEHAKFDNNGNAVLHLVAESAVYKFIVRKNGEVTFISYDFNGICTTSPCQINIIKESGINSLTNYTKIDNLDYNIHVSRPNRKITLTAITDDASVGNFTLLVKEANTNTYICNTTSQFSGGTVDCNVLPNYGNDSYIVTSYYNQVMISQGLADFTQNANFGYSGIIVTVLLYLTLVFMAIPTGAIAVMLFGLLGLIFASFLGFISAPNVFAYGSIIIWLVIASVIIIIKLSRRSY